MASARMSTPFIIFSHHERFHPIDLDFISRIFTEKYAIILFDFQWNPFSVFIPFSGTNRYDLPLFITTPSPALHIF
jgi:hypothetical protein